MVKPGSTHVPEGSTMYFITKAVLLGAEQACPFKCLFSNSCSYQSASIGTDSSYITGMVKRLLHTFFFFFSPLMCFPYGVVAVEQSQTCQLFSFVCKVWCLERFLLVWQHKGCKYMWGVKSQFSKLNWNSYRQGQKKKKPLEGTITWHILKSISWRGHQM